MGEDDLHARVSVLESETASHKEEMKAVEDRSGKRIESVDKKLSATNKTLMSLAIIVIVSVITEVMNGIGIGK